METDSPLNPPKGGVVLCVCGTVEHDKISNSLHSFPCYQGWYIGTPIRGGPSLTICTLVTVARLDHLNQETAAKFTA